MKSTIFLTLLLSVLVSSITQEEIPSTISQGIEKLQATGTAPLSLTNALQQLQRIADKQLYNEAFCQVCNDTIDKILVSRRTGSSKESMRSLFQKFCYTLLDWGKTVCDGYIDIELDTVLYIADNSRGLTADRVCSTLFQVHQCQDRKLRNWSIDIPPLPAVSMPRKKVQINSSDEQFRILHLTDMHYDPLYSPGSNAECAVDLCCQENYGRPSDPEKVAGYWSDYRECDTPQHAFINLMNEIKNNHNNFSYVYFTGDIISHKSWATTKESNSESIRFLFTLFKKTFGEVPVYPILGNHETHPTDFYSPANITDPALSTQWVFDLAVELWSQWLPEDTQSTIRAGGYYTVLVRPGFRIVALNSNVCYTSNLWILYDDEDQYGQLKWLVQVLTEAERNGEQVHILSHVPPGHNQCLANWAKEFRRIVNRFSSTITAQFNGHTHWDEFRVFYDLNEDTKAISVAFNGGSFTTFVGFNPNFRLYDVDSKSFRISDYDHYTYNLTEANTHTYPTWYKLYSLKEAYGMEDTKNEDFADLIVRMNSNKTLVEQYQRLQGRASDPFVALGCDKTCLKQALCSITAVDTEQIVRCDNLK